MKINLTLAHYLRAYDRIVVDVTAEELHELRKAESADELDEVLAGVILERGHTVSSRYDSCDEPFYNVLDVALHVEGSQS